MIKNGSILEHGSFDELMNQKGHLATLIGEHVQIIDPLTVDSQVHTKKSEKDENDSANNQVVDVKSINEKIIGKIEEHELQIVNLDRADTLRSRKHDLNTVFETNDPEEIVPHDSEPMKLVLEDQSVNYKKSPVLAYLRSGTGIIVTLMLFIFFFMVHLVRIGSGKL